MSDPRGAPMRFPLPVTLFAVAVVLSILVGMFLPLPWIPRPLSDILMMVGLIAIVAGAALILSAMRRMTLERTTVRPDRAAQKLVTDGPFRISRNPIYLGMAMMMFGIGLAAHDVWFFVFGLIACFVLQKAAIEPEERHLDTLFGKRYRDYRKVVRRWI